MDHGDWTGGPPRPTWGPPDGWIPGPPPIGSARQRAGFIVAGLVVAILVTIGGVGALLAIGGAVGPNRGPGPGGPGPTFDPAVVADPASFPRLDEAECRFAAPFHVPVDCFDLSVAQDRGDASRGVVRLHVGIYRSAASDPAPDPVVFLSGGPGGAALFGYEDFAYLPFLERRDLVVLDQRGTGLSVPSLDCPELDAVDGLSVGSALEARQATGDCRERLIREGVSLESYTSAESAADLRDLRRALGIASWNLYGISYGTRLALTAMRDHPEGIRSVILDAPYPPNADLYEEGARNAARAFEQLFDVCDADAACRAAHIGLEGRFYLLIRQLDERPLTVYSSDRSTSWSVDGQVLIDYLFEQLYLTPVIPSLPATIDDLHDGRTGALAEYLEQYYAGEPVLARIRQPVLAGTRGPALTDPLDVADGMYLSVQCHEEVPFFDRTAFEEYGNGVIGEIVEAFDPDQLEADCEEWAVPAAGPREAEAVVSEIPTLLLSGEFDPVTAPAWADLAAETLSNGRAVHFAGSGHGALGDSTCSADIVNSFLDDPSRAVDADCVVDVVRKPFDP